MEADLLAQLRRKNPGIALFPVEDTSFGTFGRLLEDVPVGTAMQYAQNIPLAERVSYEPSVPELEADIAVMNWLYQQVYGGMPVELGWCYGKNTSMNGLEYHKSSEVMVALTDIAILVGSAKDIKWQPDPHYDSSHLVGYLVPKGSAIELFPLTLHFAPIGVHPGSGFRILVGLPRGTNFDLEFPFERFGENRLLAARNKWLIVHPDASQDLVRMAFTGITGENISLIPTG